MGLIERTEAAQRALEAALGPFPTGGGYQLAADVLAAADAAEASQLQGAVDALAQAESFLAGADLADDKPSTVTRVTEALRVIRAARGR